MRGLLVGEDKAVADWAFSTFKLHVMPVDCALGIVIGGGELVGAVLLQGYNGHNIELSYYGNRTVTPGIVRSIARLLVNRFNVSRLTAVTSKRNRRLMRSLIRIGFKFEGIQRCYYGHRDMTKNTGARFVMFRDRIEELASVPQSTKGAA